MKWTPPGGWPDRRHAAAVAREFAKARARARELADELWRDLNPESDDDGPE